MAAQPLILTLAVDGESAGFFDRQRRRYFPPERNVIPAHLTLFHHLPGEEEEAIAKLLRDACAQIAPFPLMVTGFRFLGRGVAYEIASPELMALRSRFAGSFDEWLRPQDRQGFRPHITIQNKVRPDEAKALIEQLRVDFEQFEIDALSLLLWRYLDGPWERRGFFPFGA